MPTIHYISADGTRTDLSADVGTSVMQAALVRGLTGINGDCGGACQCATCHVFIDEPWASMLPPRDDMEDAMLDSSAAPRRETSRLSCCINMTAELDGIVVRLPARQV